MAILMVVASVSFILQSALSLHAYIQSRLPSSLILSAFFVLCGFAVFPLNDLGGWVVLGAEARVIQKSVIVLAVLTMSILSLYTTVMNPLLQYSLIGCAIVSSSILLMQIYKEGLLSTIPVIYMLIQALVAVVVVFIQIKKLRKQFWASFRLILVGVTFICVSVMYIQALLSVDSGSVSGVTPLTILGILGIILGFISAAPKIFQRKLNHYGFN